MDRKNNFQNVLRYINVFVSNLSLKIHKKLNRAIASGEGEDMHTFF